MFTIMHERPNGNQELCKAVRVQFIPFTEENEGVAGVHMLCSPDEAGPGIGAGHLRDGRVFVMNDKGATVAQYNLNIPQSPPPKN